MIGKISARGKRVAGLIYYLYGPGRHEEHTDPHIVAGWRDPAELEPPIHHDGRRDFRRLNGLLEQPHVALGRRGFDRPVWQCSVRAAPGDRMLSDDEWADVARDIMHRTGLAPHGQDDDAVRWTAVRHAGDHIHIVAMLARQDGTRPRFWNDFYRVGEACHAAEKRFGLRTTAPRDRTVGPRPTRGESEKARRQGRTEAPRVTLRRAVITAVGGAADQRDFFTRLDQAGILVRKRFSSRNPGEVTGYSVALPGDTARTGEPVWYSGSKLAPDLTWPKLRHRWASPQAPADSLTWAERNAIWEQVTQSVAGATAEIRRLVASDPHRASDAAWAAADTLHAAATALGSPDVQRAADSFARAARTPHGRIPRHSPGGGRLRKAARLLSSTAMVTGDPTLAQITLIARLAALAETIGDLRQAQRHAAQAAAARRAAEHLTAARCAYGESPALRRTRARGPGASTRHSFPVPIREALRRASAEAGPSTTARTSRPSGPLPPRPRGPTR